MKTFVRLLFFSGALAVGAHAAPFLAVSDDAELFLTGTLGVRQDSNIYLTSKATSDTVFEVDPGLQYVFGNKSPTKGTFSFTDSYVAYSSHSQLNANLISTSLNSNYDDGKSKATFNASYVELNQNTVDVSLVNGTAVGTDALIRRNIFSAGASGEVRATEKSTVGAGFQYGDTEYRRAGYSSNQSISVPVNFYYAMTPKLDASFGYRYSSIWQKLDVDAADHFFNVGLRGEITPKLSGEVHVGVTKRHYFGKVAERAGISDSSLLGVDSNFIYAVSPKSSVQFGVSNDFEADARGRPEKNFAVSAGSSFNISEQLSITTALRYRAIHYFPIDEVINNAVTTLPQRTDHYWEAQIGATYQFSSNINVTAAVAYRKNQSDLSGAEFNGNVWSLAANFRY